MSGPSLSPESLPKYATDLGYDVMADAYTAQSEVWRAITNNIIPVSALMDAPYGHRAVSLVGVGEPTQYHDGQEVPAQTMGEGWPIHLAARQYADRLIIPDSLLEAANAQQRVVALVTEFTRKYGANASILKDRYIAGMFQKGTLAAGSAEYFDNSYVGSPDPYPAFIYDGKPWFAASGNNHTLKGSSTTLYNLDAGLTLDATNLDAVYRLMSTTNAVDERGNPIVNQPTKLIVGPAMRTTALQLLESQNLPGTGNNDVNPNRGLVQLVLNRYLIDDSNAWWLATDDAGLLVVDSGVPVIESYRVPERRCTVVQAHFRFGAVVKDWRGAFSAAKATS